MKVTIGLSLPTGHPWIENPPFELAVQSEESDEVVFATLSSRLAGPDAEASYFGEVQS